MTESQKPTTPDTAPASSRALQMLLEKQTVRTRFDDFDTAIWPAYASRIGHFERTQEHRKTPDFEAQFTTVCKEAFKGFLSRFDRLRTLQRARDYLTGHRDEAFHGELKIHIDGPAMQNHTRDMVAHVQHCCLELGKLGLDYSAAYNVTEQIIIASAEMHRKRTYETGDRQRGTMVPAYALDEDVPPSGWAEAVSRGRSVKTLG